MGFIRSLSRQYWLLSVVWTLSVGITVPVLLTCFCCGGRWDSYIQKQVIVTAPPASGLAVLVQFVQLEFLAIVFCGPGAFVLTLIAYAILVRSAQKDRPLYMMIDQGAIIGTALAFANLPGYLSGFLLNWERSLTEVRVTGLFIIAGTVSGTWIAWQAYRATHSEARFFPQYSLKTLLLLVIFAGCVMMLYAPRPL